MRHNLTTAPRRSQLSNAGAGCRTAPVSHGQAGGPGAGRMAVMQNSCVREPGALTMPAGGGLPIMPMKLESYT